MFGLDYKFDSFKTGKCGCEAKKLVYTCFKKTRLHMFHRSLHMLLLNCEHNTRKLQHQDLGLSRPGVQSVLQLPPDAG